MGRALTDVDLAALSAAVYGGWMQLDAVAPDGWAVELEEYGGRLNGVDQKAYVLRSNGAACLVFRGTVPTNIRDWLVNFRVRKKGTAWGKVHAGAFYRGARLYTQLAPDLGDLNRLYITGHSLGGQVATIVAHSYFRGERYPVDLVTFGAPKALSWCARRQFPEYIQVREYLDRRDPVGYVPMFNYWRLEPIRIGKWGWVFHKPHHYSETYYAALKALKLSDS